MLHVERVVFAQVEVVSQRMHRNVDAVGRSSEQGAD